MLEVRYYIMETYVVLYTLCKCNDYVTKDSKFPRSIVI